MKKTEKTKNNNIDNKRQSLKDILYKAASDLDPEKMVLISIFTVWVKIPFLTNLGVLNSNITIVF